MFNQITYAGFGLIGSSQARAVRQNGLSKAIVCGDKNPQVCKIAREKRLADRVTTDLGEAVRGSDLVALNVPIGAAGDAVKEMAPYLEKGMIVTDVGSAKQSVIDTVLPHLPDGVFFVPGHPIAGTEHSGPESGFASLFQDRWTILTPLEGTPEHVVNKVKSYWEGMGSKVELMTPKHHDTVLALTSHVPHLIAFTIVGTASDLEYDLQREVVRYAGSGFQDFTRIAASNPTMWRDIFLGNDTDVLEVFDRLISDLSSVRQAIVNRDGDFLYKHFAKAKSIRQALVKEEFGIKTTLNPQKSAGSIRLYGRNHTEIGMMLDHLLDFNKKSRVIRPSTPPSFDSAYADDGFKYSQEVHFAGKMISYCGKVASKDWARWARSRSNIPVKVVDDRTANREGMGWRLEAA